MDRQMDGWMEKQSYVTLAQQVFYLVSKKRTQQVLQSDVGFELKF